jgi:hypothetical protein
MTLCPVCNNPMSYEHEEGHPPPMRPFLFDLDVTLRDAIRTIKAALDDEDLRLTEPDNARQQIVSVISGGKKVVLVPKHRIARA